MSQPIAQRMTIAVGDITTLDVDAIVNAANESLLPGGGVCGAIHRAAGPRLAAACAAIGDCPTGSAVLTPGYDLPARWVVHAVGPVWRGGGAGEPAQLAGCYRKSLELCVDHALQTLAFPAISTGIFGYPPDLATAVAVATVAAHLRAADRPRQVVFCCFDAPISALYRAALGDRLKA